MNEFLTLVAQRGSQVRRCFHLEWPSGPASEIRYFDGFPCVASSQGRAKEAEEEPKAKEKQIGTRGVPRKSEGAREEPGEAWGSMDGWLAGCFAGFLSGCLVARHGAYRLIYRHGEIFFNYFSILFDSCCLGLVHAQFFLEPE